IDTQREQAKAVLSEKVAVINRELAIDWQSESHLGNMLAEALRQWTGAEIGIVNSGQILSSLGPGHITREILLEICPSPINPCRMELVGDALLRALEQSLIDEYQDMKIMGFGFRGKVLGSLCV